MKNKHLEKMYETGCTLSIQFVYGTVTGGRTVFFKEETRVAQKKNAEKKIFRVKRFTLAALQLMFFTAGIGFLFTVKTGGRKENPGKKLLASTSPLSAALPLMH